MNINQRSTKTEQFITAKISGNALKQGSKAYCKNTRLRKCLVEQQSIRTYTGGLADRVDSLKLAKLHKD